MVKHCLSVPVAAAASQHTASQHSPIGTRHLVITSAAPCSFAAYLIHAPFLHPQAAAGDGRSTGRKIIRGSTWSSTMSRSARRFGMEMASFLRR